jgi:hypothetical protein
MSSTTTLSLQLSPNRSGKMQIPAITWDGESTRPIAIEVSNDITPSQNQSANAGISNHIFFESHLDDQAIYYGGAKLLTVRLYTDQPLTQANLDFPASSDIKLQQMGDDQQGSEIRNGQRYQYIERRYLLTPQKSGSLVMQGPMLNAQIPDTSRSLSSNDPFFDNFMAHSPLANMMETRPIRLQAKPIMFTVKPKPVAISTEEWLPASNLQFSATWNPDGGQVNVGEPINLQLHVQAEGINATQLPDLAAKLKLPANVKAYPDQAKIETKNVDGKLIAVMDQDIALIAQSAGEVKLPEITFPWWNTLANRPEQAAIPAKSWRILASGLANANQVNSTKNLGVKQSEVKGDPTSQNSNIASHVSTLVKYWQDNQTRLWMLILLIALSLLVVTWWFFKKSHEKSSTQMQARSEKTQEKNSPSLDSESFHRPEKTISKQAAIKNLQTALKDQNLGLARHALLDWAKVTLPQQQPIGLIALANKVEDADLKSAILALDRAVYAKNTEFNQTLQDKELIGGQLMQALKKWKKADEPPLEKSLIAELYL